MKKSGYPNLLRITAIILTMCLILPMSAMAAVVEPIQPMASDYLSSYYAYMYDAGGGNVQVWFETAATGYMDTIGAKSIAVQYSKDNATWITVEVYTPANTPSLVTSNAHIYASHVEYDGTVGYYYRAYVGIWAENNGGGDTRYFYTDSIQAKSTNP